MNACLRTGWTVGIPTFNRYHMLKQALASAESQTHKPAEIIVSDNCSTDQTGIVSISDSAIRLRYFRHSEPVHPTANFRTALDMCETEYFSWLQDDDYLFPGTGEAFSQAFALNDQAVAVIGYAYHARDINRIRANQTTVWGPPAFQMDFDRGTPMEVPVGCLVPWLTFFGQASLLLLRSKLRLCLKL
jgi:glycosyltransferase involved in cell wall biosynthesis